MDSYKLCSLLFETTPDYSQNLQTLKSLIDSTQKNSLIVAPEVCLTGFDYDNFDDAIAFAPQALEQLLELSTEKIIVFTIIEKVGDAVLNVAKILHNKEVVYSRPKAKLFRFGGEEKYFSEGDTDSIEIITVAGIKIALLVCFELRFKALWQKCEGADVIVVPAWWGALRTQHYKVLTHALAIINQCYVVASDSKNEECSKMSGVIDPQGKELRNGNKACLEVAYDKKEIALMRRYMDVGIG